MPNINLPELNKYWHGTCRAPEYVMDMKYKCGRVFLEKLTRYPNPIYKWWQEDNLNWEQLLNKFKTKLFFEKSGIVYYSCQKKEVGKRVFDYYVEKNAKQTYSNALCQSIRKGYKYREVGVGRVQEYEGKYYVLFNQDYIPEDYIKESIKILQRSYPYGGEFYIVNNHNKQLHYIKMTYNDYPPENENNNSYSYSAKDAKISCLYPERNVILYNYYYLAP